MDPTQSDPTGSAPYSPALRDLKNRLRRIEGQIRGIQKMLDENRYCVDILTQLAAVDQSLKKVSLMVSEAHAKGCVTRAIQEGQGDQAIEELVKVIFKFAR